MPAVKFEFKPSSALTFCWGSYRPRELEARLGTLLPLGNITEVVVDIQAGKYKLDWYVLGFAGEDFKIEIGPKDADEDRYKSYPTSTSDNGKSTGYFAFEVPAK